MADGILPSVRLVLPCDEVALDLRDEKWALKNPWSAVLLPAGATFPFRLTEVWVYAQLTDGVGEFDLRMEVVQVRDDGSRRAVGAGPPTRMRFPGGHQIFAYDTAFHLKRVIFRGPGVYEFRVVAETDPGVFRPLAGQSALLRVIDLGGL